MPNGVTNSSDTLYLGTINEAWGGAVESVKEVEGFSKIDIPNKLDTYGNLGILILLIIFFVLATERIVEGVGRSFHSALSIKKLKEIDWELTLRSSRTTTFIFVTLLFSFVLSHKWKVIFNGFEEMPSTFLFVIISAGIFATVLIKYGILYLIDYCNKSNTFRFIGRIFTNYLIISFSALILLPIIDYLIPSFFEPILRLYSIVSLIVPYIIYIFISTKIIFENKFSTFFYILYICALEILPILLFVKVVSLL